VQNAQQATKLVERQAVKLAKLTHLEEERLWVQEERVSRIQLVVEKEQECVRQW
jgi:hypothetical protein